MSGHWITLLMSIGLEQTAGERSMDYLCRASGDVCCLRLRIFEHSSFQSCVLYELGSGRECGKYLDFVGAAELKRNA